MAKTKLPTKQLAAMLIVSENARNVIAADDSVVVSGADRKIYTGYSTVIPGIDVHNRQLITGSGDVSYSWQDGDFPNGATVQSVPIGWDKVDVKTADFVVPPIGPPANRIDTILVDASLGPVLITLPTPFVFEEGGIDPMGKSFTVKKIDSSANAVTIGAGAEPVSLIDGALTQLLATQYESLTVRAGADTWNIIARI